MPVMIHFLEVWQQGLQKQAVKRLVKQLIYYRSIWMEISYVYLKKYSSYLAIWKKK